MLTDLQRLDYAETMMSMSEGDRTAYLAEKLVTETTDIDVINQLMVDLSNQDAPVEACDAPAEEVAPSIM